MNTLYYTATVILHAVAVVQMDHTLEEKDKTDVFTWYHIM